MACSVCSDAETEGAGLIQPHPGARLSRPASHWSLPDVERRAVEQKWARMREVFVLWLVSSGVTLVVSWCGFELLWYGTAGCSCKFWT